MAKQLSLFDFGVTTENKTEQAAKRYVEERKACGVESDITLDEIDAAFIAGAEWAQKKLREECDAAFYLGLRSTACQWHKADINPPVHKNYLCFDGYGYSVACKYGNNWFDTNSGDRVKVVAWCEFIPVTQD